MTKQSPILKLEKREDFVALVVAKCSDSSAVVLVSDVLQPLSGRLEIICY